MRYAQILPTFWTRGSGRQLRGNKAAQVLALYLMTCPACNLIGLYYQAKITICHETGLGVDEFGDALGRLSGIAHYDTENELVWVPALAEMNLGDSISADDNRAKGMLTELREWEGHAFADEFRQLFDSRCQSTGVPTDNSKRQKISKARRYQVLKRDNFTCQYCGARAPDAALELDHIKPVSKGGTNDVDNLRAACQACNSGKSNT